MEPCLECGNKEFSTKDGETACTKCGLVVGERKYSQIIPVGDVHTPSNSFSYGKGLGGTIGESGICVMIGKDQRQTWKCPRCGMEFNDTPQRVEGLKRKSQAIDHPRIATMIKLGKQRARQFGFGEEMKGQRVMMFRQFFGDRIRDVGSIVVLRSSRLSTPILVDVCFALALKDFYGDQKFEEVQRRLALDPNDLEEFGFLYKVTKKVS